jgi:hypothetical protein
MINIQLFGGPGTGKSTTAAGLFYKMKMAGYKVEYITEYAKELTFAGEDIRLSDQLHILGEQHHRLKRLEGKVDYVIHDSPFLMGLMYLNDNDIHLPKTEFKNLILSMYKSYNNSNIFLNRNEEIQYQKYGRSQELSEAIKIDNKIKNMLDNEDIKYMEFMAHKNTVDRIYSYVGGK